MRMWNVIPSKLCNKHLLGEHVEMHMLAGTIKKGISIKGYITKGLVNPAKIKERHELLAAEMINRGMNHQSPLQHISNTLPIFEINKKASEKELSSRCVICSLRIKRHDHIYSSTRSN